MRCEKGTQDKVGHSSLAASGAPFETYAEAVDWINARVPLHGIRHGLERMERLMELLDHPERRLRFIHVAGTNGKGSTCAFLTEALIRSGYDVGTFTSPYIEKFTNRLQYNGQDIPEEELLRLTNLLRPIIAEIENTSLGAPTMFEIVTTIALLYYARVVYPDFVVWEAGLGGRRDCTNIVTPVVSVITNIGLDHMDIIGDSIVEIAIEKAGIIKPGVPVVSGVEQVDAIREIEVACLANQSSLYLMEREYHFEKVSVEPTQQIFDFHSPFRTYKDLRVGLSGQHQLKNASAALMTLELLRQYNAVILDEEPLIEAFASAKWPGRLELLTEQPRLLIDGAHNPHAAEALVQAIRETYKYAKLRMMIGMIASKDHRGFLQHILPLVDTIIITEPDYYKKLAASDLFKQAEDLLRGMDRRPVLLLEPDWKKALNLLVDGTTEEDLAVVSGTLYMISDVRSWVINQSESEKGW
ncbi:MAG: bifunctional folylpolyglutamate synthase/dihydrofolate synthase [Gorillibacterium sp.]|nr:bifunctional folylpolyglutamate synthase/dihydrofolate synthase [Gorillibacterium sp.]